MNSKNAETLQIYIEESLEHLVDIEQDLLQIEKDGAQINNELVNKLFRAAHSIKGGAGFIGLSNIRELSHRMENVLGAIRNRKLTPNSEIVSVLLSASDQLREMFADCEKSNDKDISQQVQALDSLLSRDKGEASEDSVQSLDPGEIKMSLPGIEGPIRLPAQFVSKTHAEGKNLYLVKLYENNAKYMGKSTDEMIDQIKSYGAALRLDAHYNDRKTADTNDPLCVAFSCILEPNETISLLEIDKECIFLFDPDSQSIVAPIEDVVSPVEQDPGCPSPAVESPKTINPAPSQVGSPSSIRVNVHLLESLINLAGELVLTRNQLLQSISTENNRLIELAAQRVDMITSELQEAIMLTRMQPVGRLLDKFPRMARDISKKLGKEVDVEIVGTEVELDRTLLETISDPLTHLVRNAIDHGIEEALERKSLGKEEIGKISIKAFHEAGQVIIEITDDGKGLNADQLASAAVMKGFITEAQAKMMNRTEKMSLIFLPGFSLAEQISELSGRGVGMDVVKTNIERIGGQIDLDSFPGKGTNIRIKLPLTLAIVAAQIVAIEDEQYAIPQQNIEELLRIPAAAVKDRVELIGEAPVVRLRGRLLPLVRLADILAFDRTFLHRQTLERERDRRLNIADRRSKRHAWPPDDSGEAVLKDLDEQNWAERRKNDRRFHASSTLNIAVVSAGSMTYGLIVGSFLDSQEIVVKPLGKQLQKCRVYSGATIMGDGRVTLILDVGNLAMEADLSSALRASMAIEELHKETQTPSGNEDYLDVLLFSNSENEHFAVPLHHVVRIEKIKTADIESLGGMRVVQYRGGNLPVFSVDETANVHPFDKTDDLKVVVFDLLQREMGLIASGPLDTARVPSVMDSHTFKQAGISGSVIINGNITLMVDFQDLLQTLHPQWFDLEFKEIDHRDETSAILIVEDSDFFRGQIVRVLEEEGFHVLQAEDGASAWKMLQTKNKEICLIVTDLEMPHMDGFELAKRIRKDDRLLNLPLIALTTLADENDMEKAKRAGINEYQIKLDKEQFLASVKSLLNERRHIGGESV